MKGLILHDIYLITKYCKSFLVILAAFLGVSLFNNSDSTFVFYPCLIISVLPITLISYDEREKWNIFSQTLPISKAKYVSSKYIIGTVILMAVVVVSSATQAIKMNHSNSFDWSDFLFMVAGLFSVSLLAPTILLPCIFKYGSEKGRIIYYIIIAIAFAMTTILNSLQGLQITERSLCLPSVAVCLIVAVLYTASWLISIALYKRREVC